MYLFGSEISYVYMECIPKRCVRDNLSVSDCKKELICGMFAGIKTDNYSGVVTDFILVQDLKVDSHFALNKTLYNVISIDKCISTGKRFFTFYSASKEDQVKAEEHLNSILSALKAQDKCFMDRNEVIVSKYTDIPTTFLSTDAPKKGTTSNKSKTNQLEHRNDTNTYSGYGCKKGIAPTSLDNKPEALFFRRKTEKPNLKQMRSWVRQVMANKYKEPEIAEIEVEETPDTATTTENASKKYCSYDDDYANGMYGY